MSMDMQTDISILLSPILRDDPPYVIVSLDDTVLFDGILEENNCVLNSTELPIGKHIITVKFNNKADDEQEKAVIIKNVQFFGIGSDSIRDTGIYTPCYPAQYALDNHTVPNPQTYGYMGWNGVWDLAFEVPVFHWIHKVEQLGWVYPSDV